MKQVHFDQDWFHISLKNISNISWDGDWSVWPLDNMICMPEGVYFSIEYKYGKVEEYKYRSVSREYTYGKCQKNNNMVTW